MICYNQLMNKRESSPKITCAVTEDVASSFKNSIKVLLADKKERYFRTPDRSIYRLHAGDMHEKPSVMIDTMQPELNINNTNAYIYTMVELDEKEKTIALRHDAYLINQNGDKYPWLTKSLQDIPTHNSEFEEITRELQVERHRGEKKFSDVAEQIARTEISETQNILDSLSADDEVDHYGRTKTERYIDIKYISAIDMVVSRLFEKNSTLEDKEIVFDINNGKSIQIYPASTLPECPEIVIDVFRQNETRQENDKAITPIDQFILRQPFKRLFYFRHNQILQLHEESYQFAPAMNSFASHASLEQQQELLQTLRSL